VCTAADFSDFTGYNIHRGCLAIAERPPGKSLDDLLRSTGLLVVLEGVANADNVGGVFRNAAAFGAGAVILSPTCCDPFYRKAIRTSMGATLSVPFVWLDQWPAPLAALGRAGFTLVALTLREPSESLDAFAAMRPAGPGKLALVLGAEGSGLSAAVEAMADSRVRIPMRPEVDSLNLAVAAGIALHRLRDGRYA
jgi:tRNA G18 (ribose-2'-O)-methylase SpoU